MEPCHHVVDPDGDLILTLRNPGQLSAAAEKNTADSVDSFLPHPEVTVEANDDLPDFLMNTLHPTVFPIPPANPVGNAAAPGDAERNDEETQKPSEIRMRLSSRHLILASSFFKKALKGPWKESQPGPDSIYRVAAEGWDEDILLILMNMIHGKNHEVPRRGDLELVYRVAVLVDYYDCHEAVALTSALWGFSLSTTVCVRDGGRDAVKMLFVSWVFGYDFHFGRAASQAIFEATGPLDTFDLPIPPKIIGELDTQDWLRFHSVQDSNLQHPDDINARRVFYLRELISCLSNAVQMLSRDK